MERWPTPASTTCRSRSRTPSRSPPTTSRATTAPTRASKRWPHEVRKLGLPLTVNMVVHRANIARIGAMVDLALSPRRDAHRDRACAVLRLGAEEPRRPDADARAGRARGERSRGAARASTRARSSSTRSCRTITRAFPKACMGGWGAPLAQHHAGRPRAAVPRRRDHSGARILECARAFARRHLANSPAFNAFRGTDWMQEPCRSCETARDGFRRLPLSGVAAHRRCARDRSGLPSLAAPRHARRTGRCATATTLTPIAADKPRARASFRDHQVAIAIAARGLCARAHDTCDSRFLDAERFVCRFAAEVDISSTGIWERNLKALRSRQPPRLFSLHRLRAATASARKSRTSGAFKTDRHADGYPDDPAGRHQGRGDQEESREQIKLPRGFKICALRDRAGRAAHCGRPARRRHLRRHAQDQGLGRDRSRQGSRRRRGQGIRALDRLHDPERRLLLARTASCSSPSRIACCCSRPPSSSMKGRTSPLSSSSSRAN